MNTHSPNGEHLPNGEVPARLKYCEDSGEVPKMVAKVAQTEPQVSAGTVPAHLQQLFTASAQHLDAAHGHRHLD